MTAGKSLNGKQLAEQNLKTFQAWVLSKTDADFRSMVSRGVLSRKEIAIECGFAKSALDQNPRIKVALKDLEDGLRSRNVLPPLAPPDPDVPLVREQRGTRASNEAERLRRLEQENAALRAEVAALKQALERHTVLQEALMLTSRLPR